MKGPSVTVYLPAPRLTRVGWPTKAPVAMSTPARVQSSMSLSISAYISGVGAGSSGEGGSGWYMKNFMVVSLCVSGAGRPGGGGLLVTSNSRAGPSKIDNGAGEFQNSF